MSLYSSLGNRVILHQKEKKREKEEDKKEILLRIMYSQIISNQTVQNPEKQENLPHRNIIVRADFSSKLKKGPVSSM